MSPDCFSTSGEQTKGRNSGMMQGGGERRRMGGDIKVSGSAGVISVEQKMVDIFSGFQ